MTELELGDRHNRAVAGLGRGTDPKIIRLVAGTLGSSIPRQHLMVCLVNLLSRLHGSVKAIQLDVAGDIIVPLPNGARPGNAFEVMKEMARWANGDRIPVLDVTGASDIAIDISAGAEAGADLYAWGAGWKGWVGSSPATFSRSDDEAEVRSFATAVSPEFSVSFVSMAAAVMTVARLFAATLFTDQASSRAAKGLFQFKNLEVDEVTTARRPACSYCQPLKMPEAARLRDSPSS